jgi:hypothetical protein
VRLNEPMMNRASGGSPWCEWRVVAFVARDYQIRARM